MSVNLRSRKINTRDIINGFYKKMFYYLDMKNKNYAAVIQNRVTNCCIPKEEELKPTQVEQKAGKSRSTFICYV
jgi:hypothetical protein